MLADASIQSKNYPLDYTLPGQAYTIKKMRHWILAFARMPALECCSPGTSEQHFQLGKRFSAW